MKCLLIVTLLLLIVVTHAPRPSLRVAEEPKDDRDPCLLPSRCGWLRGSGIGRWTANRSRSRLALSRAETTPASRHGPRGRARSRPKHDVEEDHSRARSAQAGIARRRGGSCTKEDRAPHALKQQ